MEAGINVIAKCCAENLWTKFWFISVLYWWHVQ